MISTKDNTLDVQQNIHARRKSRVNAHYVHMHMYFQCMSLRLFSFLSVFLSKTEPVSIHAPHTRFETTT